jgi:hypothetical protein
VSVVDLTSGSSLVYTGLLDILTVEGSGYQFSLQSILNVSGKPAVEETASSVWEVRVEPLYYYDIIPTEDNTFALGSTGLRWKSLYIGPGSLYLQDTNIPGLNAELTMTDGVLQVNGADQLQVGNLKFVGNSIESTEASIDITLGRTGAIGNFIINRDVILNKTSLTNVGDFGCTGQATFYRSPHIPEPAANNDAASKGYVDSMVGHLGVTGPTGSILFSLGGSGVAFSKYEVGLSTSKIITGTQTNITTLSDWSTLSSSYVVYIDNDTISTLLAKRVVHFPDLSDSSGSAYQQVIVHNGTDNIEWSVTSNNTIRTNSVAGVNTIVIPHVQTGKINTVTFRSFKNGANYEWIGFQ